MSVRSASVPALRDGARDLRAQAARLASAAAGTERVRRAVEPHWWGPHGVRWQSRARALTAAERRGEACLKRLAAAVERYADAVERAQRALEQIDREADAARAAAGQLVVRWTVQPVHSRGPRPSGVPALGSLHARQQQVEAQAERDAQAFAAAMRAAVGELTSLEVAADAVGATVTASGLWTSVVRTCVLRPLPVPTLAPVVPGPAAPVVVPVQQPQPRTALVPTGPGEAVTPMTGVTALDALASVVAPLLQAATVAPSGDTAVTASGVQGAVAELSAAVYRFTTLAWAAAGTRPTCVVLSPWDRPRPQRPLVPRPRRLHAPTWTATGASR